MKIKTGIAIFYNCRWCRAPPADDPIGRILGYCKNCRKDITGMSANTQKYSIDHLENPSDSNRIFDDLGQAELEAVKRSADNHAWVVYKNPAGAIISIVFQHEVFKREK